MGYSSGDLSLLHSIYSILPDLQTVFGHLQESKLQYYTPDTFWKNFKLYGQPINVREQRDALEFFNDLIDQVDEILKVPNWMLKIYKSHVLKSI